MAWSTPLTAVANSALTSAQWNASVRDNLLETAPAKATASGQIFVSTAANAIAARTPTTSSVTTSQTTTSTSFTDLSTVGPTVTVTTGTRAIVIMSARMANSTATASSLMSYEVTGASALSPSDSNSVWNQSAVANMSIRASSVELETGLTAGSNTFQAKYRATAGTGTFLDRTLMVIPL